MLQMNKLNFMLVCLFVFSLFSIIPTAFAQEPTEVSVGLYILNLGRFDISTGSFTADFYLSMQCAEECDPSTFEFINGRATSTDKIIDEPTEKFYRIQANLNSPIDLKNFPFDSQQMQIILEDKEKTITELRYITDAELSGIDDSITFSGWNIDNWNVATSEHEYSIYDETYSQYQFSVNISRIKINSFFKTFLPVLFMILILTFTFIMGIDKIVTRLTISTSTLVAATMFHISISNQIPPVGYLTIADKFMILTYLIILGSVILNVFLLRAVEKKKATIAEQIHTRMEYAVFITVPLLYILFFIVVLI